MKITVGKKPFPMCETEISANPSLSDVVPELRGMFTLSVHTGSAMLHTYLTHDELVSLANGLLALAEMSEVKA